MIPDSYVMLSRESLEEVLHSDPLKQQANWYMVAHGSEASRG